MSFDPREIKDLTKKWQAILRLQDWDIMLRMTERPY